MLDYGECSEGKNGREAAIEHHAQNGLPLHERVGPLRGSEPHHPGSGWPTMTSISLLWGIGSILSDEEIKCSANASNAKRALPCAGKPRMERKQSRKLAAATA